MNKQEAIEKIKNIETLNIKDRIADKGVDMVIKNQVIGIVSQIDEPQKPVIPKFVAERLEETKNNCLLDVILCSSIEIKRWLYGEENENEKTFIRAWLDGYEIEKEKLYTVEIPDPNSFYKHRFLSRNGNGVCIDASNDIGWKQRRENQLTEAEIKQDFDFLREFAKPVEDK